jgi:hypothetical protein
LADTCAGLLLGVSNVTFRDRLRFGGSRCAGGFISVIQSHLDGEHDESTRYVAVLEIPPVVSPETAVKASIVADAKNRK